MFDNVKRITAATILICLVGVPTMIGGVVAQQLPKLPSGPVGVNPKSMVSSTNALLSSDICSIVGMTVFRDCIAGSVIIAVGVSVALCLMRGQLLPPDLKQVTESVNLGDTI